MPQDLTFLGEVTGGEGALLERAASALERAYGFVDQHGEPFARLRADVAVEARPRHELGVHAAKEQHGDGSLRRPAHATGPLAAAIGEARLPPAIADSLQALIALSDHGLFQGDCVAGAVRFVGVSQRADGAWLQGGDPDARVFSTGAIAGTLARTPFARPETISKAGSLLEALWSPERIDSCSWGILAGFSQFFSNSSHELADEALQRCGRAFERGFRERRFDGLACARILLLCDAVVLPGSRVEPAELLGVLLDEQAADGGFDALSTGGAAARAVPTVEVMIVVRALCANL